MEKKSHPQAPQALTKSSKKQAPDTRSAEFIAHVHEFRNRIFWVALLFIASSAFAYQVREVLVDVVLSPLGDQKLIYLTPAGGFSFIFQITMYAGAVVSAPFLVYQLYRFVTPALPPRAQRHSARIFIAAMLLMISGVMFGYFVAVPSALHFLTTFAGGYVEASLTADSYLNFILGYVVGLGVLFLLPLLLIFWHWIKPLTPGGLMKSERFMIVFSMIAAAIITPTPDVVNQLLIAGPILVVYQLGVVTVLVMIRGERRRMAQAVRRAEQRNKVGQPAARLQPITYDFSIDDVTALVRPVGQARAVQPAQAVHVAAKPVTHRAPTAKPQPAVLSVPAVPAQPQRLRAVTPRSYDSVNRSRPAMVRSLPKGVVRPAVTLRSSARPLHGRPVSIDGFAISAG